MSTVSCGVSSEALSPASWVAIKSYFELAHDCCNTLDGLAESLDCVIDRLHAGTKLEHDAELGADGYKTLSTKGHKEVTSSQRSRRGPYAQTPQTSRSMFQEVVKHKSWVKTEAPVVSLSETSSTHVAT